MPTLCLSNSCVSSPFMLMDSIRSLHHSASMPAMRNTPTFKSFEERVETLKTKVTPTPSPGNIEEVMNSTANSEPIEKQPEATPLPGEDPHLDSSP
ncbi:tumor protein D53-like isoform X2 [Alosa sapidissima]|uniref:tumor protein D53-like isoform X2 n=1 Tax=Alosa sapidissima TaxID=34773 RepID=UPI001C095150|nr:tumor protein D53-like isoform X2 [Alosa sapidissima]